MYIHSPSSLLPPISTGSILLYTVHSAGLQNTLAAYLLRGNASHHLNECPGYDIKQSDSEAPVMLEFLVNLEYPFIAIAPMSTLA